MMLEILSLYFFSVTGNIAYDAFRQFWNEVTGKSIEEIYLESFEVAVIELESTLQK
jgi:hypothetical protein